MYGYDGDDEQRGIKNEISITNLITIANNDRLYDALDTETKTKLLQIISAYTKGCVRNIMENNNYAAKKLRENFDKEETRGIL